MLLEEKILYRTLKGSISATYLERPWPLELKYPHIITHHSPCQDWHGFTSVSLIAGLIGIER